jgi:hypothetical protein
MAGCAAGRQEQPVTLRLAYTVGVVRQGLIPSRHEETASADARSSWLDLFDGGSLNQHPGGVCLSVKAPAFPLASIRRSACRSSRC